MNEGSFSSQFAPLDLVCNVLSTESSKAPHIRGMCAFDYL